MAGGIKTLICRYPSSGPNPDALLLQVDPADLGAPACTSKKRFKSLWDMVGDFGHCDISWQCRELSMGPSAPRQQGRRGLHKDHRVVLRGSSWLQAQADGQGRLDVQAKEGNPMFAWAHWPNSPCGRASAAARARPPSRSALECVFIYILPGETAWGVMMGAAAALPG